MRRLKVVGASLLLLSCAIEAGTEAYRAAAELSLWATTKAAVAVWAVAMLWRWLGREAVPA